MGVKRAGMTWVLLGGLVLLLLSERVFREIAVLRTPVLVVGMILLVAATGWRLFAWLGSQGETRRIERTFALGSIGCVIAAIGLMLGTVDGVAFLGLDFDSPVAEARFRRILLAGSSILLAISLLPTLAAQWALRSAPREQSGALQVESRRVLETATSALSVAMAGCLMMLVGYLTSAHNQTVDASYFKTSSPGSSVQEVVLSFEETLEAILFFPSVDPVKDQVRTYFEQLGAATGNVAIREVDRLVEPQTAEEYDVSLDGTVLLVRGDRREEIVLPLELNAARGRLRQFDGEVQETLLRLSRAQRMAYLTIGHGELNDPATQGAGARALEGGGEPPLAALRQLLELLNYRVQDIGLRNGLGERIPDDAAIVFVVGPRSAFLETEIDALNEYLDRGGSLLMALETDSEFDLTPFRDQLGLDYTGTRLIDDQRFIPRQGGIVDREVIVTDQFSSHASVTTASRAGLGSGILLVGAGSLTAADDVQEPRRRAIIQSLATTFADLDGDYRFSESEDRGGYTVAYAVEGPQITDPSRALVFADAEMFSDPVLVAVGLNAAVLADGVRWLGGEEDFAGETVSEVDVPIVHTNSEDVAWFYAIILGGPALVLGAGLFNLMSRRRRRQVA